MLLRCAVSTNSVHLPSRSQRLPKPKQRHISSSPPNSKTPRVRVPGFRLQRDLLHSRTEPQSQIQDELVSLTNREITQLLLSQRHWRSSVELLDRLRSLPDYVPSVVHYTIVLRSVALARQWDSLRLLWLQMARDRVPPNNHTYSMLIDVYARAGLPPALSLQWIRHMRLRGISPDEVTMNTVLRVLKNSALYSSALAFFRSWCQGIASLDVLQLDDACVESFTPKHFILTELFRSGSWPQAPQQLSQPEAPWTPVNSSTYNNLIDLYAKAGLLEEASNTFATMLQSGVAPDTTTFNTMIHICGSHGGMEEAEALLQKMEEREVLPDITTFNVFMSMYTARDDVDGVLRYYRKITRHRLRPNEVTFRILLQFLCERGMIREAENIVEDMEQLKVAVDEHSLPFLTNMYVSKGLPLIAMQFLEKHCFGRDVSWSTYASILDVYAEKGLWEDAEHVFNARKCSGCKVDVAEYNVIIKAYGKARIYDKALRLVESMENGGAWPDACTYNTTIQMLSQGDLLDEAREYLAKMSRAGFKPRRETFSAVIACCSRLGLVFEAQRWFDEMKVSGIEPNEVVYGAMIHLYVECDRTEDALRYYETMKESGISDNHIILTTLIKGYCKLGLWLDAEKLYERMKAFEGGPDVIASNCLMNLYSQLGMVNKAEAMFEELRQNSQADRVSYNTMMHMYKSMGMPDKKLKLSQDMQHAGLLTDCGSFNSIIASYVSNGLLKECVGLLGQMQENGISPDKATFNILFAALRKGGLPPEAVMQLQRSYADREPYAEEAIMSCLHSIVGMHECAIRCCKSFLTADKSPGLFAYNAAIFVYLSSDKVNDALKLLMGMQAEDLDSDTVNNIYLAICYGKAGLVDGIRRIHLKLKYGDLEPAKSLIKAVAQAYKDAGKPGLARLFNQEMRFIFKEQHEDDFDVNNDSDVENNTHLDVHSDMCNN